MKNKFNNSSLKKKIIVTFCTILMINVLVTGSAYYIFSNQDTVSDFQRNSSDMVRQIEIYLGDKISDLTQRVTAFGNNLSFTNPMNTFLLDEQTDWNPVLAGNVASMISEITMSDEFVDSMYIYTEKGIFDDYLLIRRRDMEFTDTVMYQYMKKNPEINVAWFPAMKNPLYEDVDETIPVVYRKKIGNQEIFFVIQISQNAIQDYLDQAYSTFDRVFMVDQNGENVLNYTQNDAFIVQTFEKESVKENTQESEIPCLKLTIENEQYLAARSIIQESGWSVFALASMSSLTESLRKIRIFLVVENVVVVCLCLAVILWISHRLTSSLEQLAETMDGAVKSGYHTEFQYPYRDEVGTLAGSYNEMIGEIRRHIQALEAEKEHVKKIQKQKRKVELMALQAQINPHFLYNTLNMITWQAVDMGAEEISIISNALGKYFRISLSRGKEIISLKEETEHVKSYLEIQKIRYKTKLTYEIELPGEIEHYLTIKLILQPLVENALYHGIKVKDGNGKILIYTKICDGKIELVVEDDGVGIPGNRLEELNKRLAQGMVDSSTGYGIYNVNNRLRLYYGECYGLRLENGEPNGIRAVVTILIIENEGDMDV